MTAIVIVMECSEILNKEQAEKLSEGFKAGIAKIINQNQVFRRAIKEVLVGVDD